MLCYWYRKWWQTYLKEKPSDWDSVRSEICRLFKLSEIKIDEIQLIEKKERLNSFEKLINANKRKFLSNA